MTTTFTPEDLRGIATYHDLMDELALAILLHQRNDGSLPFPTHAWAYRLKVFVLGEGYRDPVAYFSDPETQNDLRALADKMDWDYDFKKASLSLHWKSGFDHGYGDGWRDAIREMQAAQRDR